MTDPREPIYKSAEFGPSEVARITGVSPELQRDWRRRGVIVMKVEGRARFYTEQVAQIMVRKALNDIGVPLTEAQTAVAIAGLLVAFQAETHDGAIEYDDEIDPNSPEATNALMGRKTGSSWRYLALPQPGITPEDFHRITGVEMGGHFRQLYPCWPVSNMGDLATTALAFQNMGVKMWSLIDLHALASHLVTEAERPLARVELGVPKARNRTVAFALDAFEGDRDADA